MKYLSLMLPVFFPFNLHPMFTSEESACVLWFEQEGKVKVAAMNKLSQEEQHHLGNSTTPKDKEQALQQLAQHFCNTIESEKKTVKYQAPFLAAALIKSSNVRVIIGPLPEPTDELTTRIFLWRYSLGQGERSTATMSVYRTEPEKTKATLEKFGALLADQLIKLNLLENTLQARQEKINQYIAQRMAEFEALCNNKKN